MLSKRLQGCVAFAHFAQEHRLQARDLAELLQLAGKAFGAAERECNTGKSAARHRQAFENRAKLLGFGTEWNGLGPTLTRENRSIYLPDVG